MKLTVKNIVAIMVLGSCANFLITTDASIWWSHGYIEAPWLLAPMTRALAKWLTPDGMDPRLAWQKLYAFAFSLNYVIYAAAFWQGNVSSKKVSSSRQALLWSVQLACCFIGMELLYQLFIAELAFRLPFRKALLAFFILFACAIVGVVCYRFGWTGMTIPTYPGYLLMAVLGNFSGMSCFFGIGYLAGVANRGRNAMAAAHAELLATQQFLAETVRSSERLRIARDLHDTIGHNLTALNLHLELASRQASEAAPASVKIARELGEELLANVRVTVSNERHDQAIDLRQALKTLCMGIPEPRIVLSVDPDFSVDMPHVAHVLFRCVQEGITNAVRHAGADTVEVILAKQDDALSLVIKDDGKGMERCVEGSGLRGMRERVEELEGTMEITSPADGGFVIRVVMPLMEAYS